MPFTYSVRCSSQFYSSTNLDSPASTSSWLALNPLCHSPTHLCTVLPCPVPPSPWIALLIPSCPNISQACLAHSPPCHCSTRTVPCQVLSLSLTFTDRLWRFTNEPKVTRTLVAAWHVFTLGIGATRGHLTLVLVSALCTHRLKAIAAEALTIIALGIVHTVKVAPAEDVDISLQVTR